MSEVVVPFRQKTPQPPQPSESREKAGKPDTWMPLYIGDYLADTRHLSTMEHGAYLLMLMTHWRTGSLPADEAKLAKISGLRLDHWRKISETVLEFFVPGDKPGTIIQKRCRRELDRAANVSKKRSDAARERWQNADATPPTVEPTYLPAKPLETKEVRDANAQLLHMPNTLTTTVTGEKEEKKDSPPTPRKKRGRKRGGMDEASEVAFEIFWDEYPRDAAGDYRGSIDRARMNWCKALKAGAKPDEILAALSADKAGLFVRRGPDYIKNPENWLTDARWKNRSAFDTPTSAESKPAPDLFGV